MHFHFNTPYDFLYESMLTVNGEVPYWDFIPNASTNVMYSPNFDRFTEFMDWPYFVPEQQIRERRAETGLRLPRNFFNFETMLRLEHLFPRYAVQQERFIFLYPPIHWLENGFIRIDWLPTRFTPRVRTGLDLPVKFTDFKYMLYVNDCYTRFTLLQQRFMFLYPPFFWMENGLIDVNRFRTIRFHTFIIDWGFIRELELQFVDDNWDELVIALLLELFESD
jgi:hypothetical protein